MKSNNSIKKTITEEKIANHKLALFASSAASFLINLLLIILLATDGIAFKYMIFPILLCTFNVLFIVTSIFVNFKFSYSILYTVLYSVLFVISSVIYGAILLNFGKESSMSYVALGLWALVSVVTVVATALATSGAGRSRISMKALVGTMVLFVCIGVYAYFVTGVGFFGQGKDVDRPITFVYDSKNEYYVASGTVDGKGNKITIPETFNDVKVGAVDCSIFSAEGVDKVEIATASDIEFLNAVELSKVDSDTDIIASKAILSDISKTLYTIAYENAHLAPSIIEFAKLLSPSDLSDNEVYITFAYDEDSILKSDGIFIPMWIGEKNQVFDLSGYSEIPYVKDSDINDEALLANLYNANSNGGGYILSAFSNNGAALVGSKISESIENVAVSFELIYRVEIAVDNDAMYELSNDFRFLDENKLDSRYRFVTKSTASALLEDVDKRAGFTLSWRYYDEDRLIHNVDSLLAIINEGCPDALTVHPIWALNAPVITACKTSDGSVGYTYGDNVSLVSDATSPAEDVYLVYEWYKDGRKIAETKDFAIDRIKISDKGTYSLTVTAKSDTCTSLTSESAEIVTLSVAKKMLPLTWLGLDGTDLNERVYTAEYSDILVDYDSDSLVYADDNITYTLSVDRIKDASTYTSKITLTGDCSDKYYVSTEHSEATYTIKKKAVDITWTVGHYTYTKSEIKPDVVISSGICLADDLTVYTTGHVTPGKYTAIAALTGRDVANYEIKTAQLKQEYTISPAVLTFNWSEVTQTYNAQTLTPSVTAVGLQGDDTQSSLNIAVTGAKNAGTHTATVTIDNSNYVIAEGENSHAFVINPAELVVTYGKTQLTYNSKVQKPVVSVQSGLCTGDTVQSLSLTVTGAKDAGVHTVTASVGNSNYVVMNNTFENFEIKTAAINVIWSSEKNLVYSGSPQYLAVQSFTGVYDDDAALVSVETDVQSSANTNYRATPYTSHATLIDSTGNYHLSTSTQTATYNITQKPLTLEWANLEFEYDGEIHAPTATIASGLVSGETVSLTLSNGKKDAGSNYVITASITDTNYTIANASAVYKIKQKKIDVLWENTEFGYDGQSHAPTATVNSTVVEGDTVTLSVSGAQKNAGQHTATVTSKNANYAINNPTVGFTISKRNITLTWGNTTLTYNAKTQTPTATATTSGNMVSGDTVVINVSGGQKNVGSYTATATTSNINYTIDNSRESFTISPLTVDVVFSNTSRVYNGSMQKPAATLKNAPSGDDYKLVITVDGDSNGAKSVGLYFAEVSTTNTNYILNHSTTTHDFEITKKTVSAVWSNTTQTYTGTALKPTVTLSGVASGDTVEITLLVDGSQNGKTNAGTYTATVSINESNYSLNSSTATKSFTIQKKEAQVSWTNTNFTYNGSAQAPTASTNAGAITLSYVYEKYDASTGAYIVLASKPTGAGTYRVTVSTPNGNYLLKNASTTFTIEELPAEESD